MMAGTSGDGMQGSPHRPFPPRFRPVSARFRPFPPRFRPV
eukprot:COSAG06_NODE_35592_length_458_cov_0.830084_2_plen_39_part_01